MQDTKQKTLNIQTHESIGIVKHTHTMFVARRKLVYLALSLAGCYAATRKLVRASVSGLEYAQARPVLLTGARGLRLHCERVQMLRDRQPRLQRRLNVHGCQNAPLFPQSRQLQRHR